MTDGTYAGDGPGRMTGAMPPKGRQGAPMKILVVEDSPSARKLLQGLLLRLGVTLPDLRLSATVPEALQVFAGWHPDVVFVDMELRPPLDAPSSPAAPAASAAGLPKNGAELAQQFLQRDPSVQVIVCSATDAADTSIGELVKKGKVQSIVKPVLAARVQEVLSRASGALEAPTRRR